LPQPETVRMSKTLNITAARAKAGLLFMARIYHEPGYDWVQTTLRIG
jgi:hypothetical protein